MASTTLSTRPVAFTWIALCTSVALVAAAGLSALWTIFAFATSGLAGWMALIAGLDAALLMRLTARPSGTTRAAASLVVYLVSVLASVYVVGAARMGSALGMQPWEALDRINPGLVQLYLLSNDAPWDWLWLGLGLVIAWRLGR